MARIIETEAGRLIGRVDRATRTVAWALVCPGCAHELAMTEQQFTGHAPMRCDCGWASPAYNPHATGDAGRWYDFREVFETAPPSTASAGAAA